ncbi:hypothetical protein E4V42_05460 [Clostridium estertheticum]|uniref:Ethanolamine utilization protein n=1 Tax=Clostridium estertheticum TaxID=238834 RepID=A0A5N7IKQ3_9CLOT|nr:hypothetical protein [Clostridium estertheticum]MPQ30884.1 hypothetical protein [Clostridium estertheticum]MPQ61560.1 hypothetical protein [Clostridium estertheticum]
MEMGKLVDMITKEVMMRIPGITNNKAIEKEKVLVISSCEQELTEVKDLIKDKYQVHIYDSENIKLEDYEHIIITNLCNKGLSSMALGLCNDKVQDFIVEGMFNGKRVYVLKEGIQYRKYSTNANEALYDLYKQYECKIMSYGIKLVQKKDLLRNMATGLDPNEKLVQEACLVKPSIHSNSNMSQSNDSYIKSEAPAIVVASADTMQSHQIVEINNKRLITESDIKKLYMSGIEEVNLIKKAILTPLAQDFIRIKRLKINRL